MCGACPAPAIMERRPFRSLLHISFAIALNLWSYSPAMQRTEMLSLESDLWKDGWTPEPACAQRIREPRGIVCEPLVSDVFLDFAGKQFLSGEYWLLLPVFREFLNACFRD